MILQSSTAGEAARAHDDDMEEEMSDDSDIENADLLGGELSSGSEEEASAPCCGLLLPNIGLRFIVNVLAAAQSDNEVVCRCWSSLV